MPPDVQRPVYQDIDLGEHAEMFAGVTLKLLCNPPDAFRTSFWHVAWKPASEEFIAHLAVILGCDLAGVTAITDRMSLEMFQWLFAHFLDGWDEDKKSYAVRALPAVFEIWDAWLRKIRVKLAARSGR